MCKPYYSNPRFHLNSIKIKEQIGVSRFLVHCKMSVQESLSVCHTYFTLGEIDGKQFLPSLLVFQTSGSF